MEEEDKKKMEERDGMERTGGKGRKWEKKGKLITH